MRQSPKVKADGRKAYFDSVATDSAKHARVAATNERAARLRKEYAEGEAAKRAAPKKGASRNPFKRLTDALRGQ
jgi:hypothetical protein